MAELGALSSYALSVQQMQMSLIKNSVEMQQEVIEILLGDGSRTAEILFVGEGPGAHEDEQGVPFVGKAGQLLDDMLAIIGLDRTMVYIANIV